MTSWHACKRGVHGVEVADALHLERLSLHRITVDFSPSFEDDCSCWLQGLHKNNIRRGMT